MQLRGTESYHGLEVIFTEEQRVSFDRDLVPERDQRLKTTGKRNSCSLDKPLIGLLVRDGLPRSAVTSAVTLLARFGAISLRVRTPSSVKNLYFILIPQPTEPDTFILYSAFRLVVIKLT